MIARQMKFVIESSVKTGARLGQLDLPHPSSTSGEVLTYPTPMYFVHTKAGSVPHLTSDVFHMVYQNIDSTAPIPPLQMSIESTYNFHSAIGPSGMSCAKFVGLQNCPTLLTLLSPLTSFKPGYNDKLGISIWSTVGRRKVTIKSVNQMTSDYKPTIVQCISDYDVCSDTMDKRLKKGTERTLQFLIETINHFKLNKSTTNTTTTDNLSLLATIEPLWFKLNENEANKTLALILEQQNHLSGFFIRKNVNDEDSNNEANEDGETTEEKVNEKVQDFITLTEPFMSKLPQDKLRIVSGSCSLDEIFSLVLQGVDAFDTSYCTKLTDEANALVLPNIFYEGDLVKMKSSVVNESLPVHEKSTNHNNNNLEKKDEETSSSGDSIRPNLQVLNLKDKRYFEDFQPLSLDCNCYTCRKFSRSYLHHLQATSELLGPVLLMKHNLTTFDRFFKVLRSYLMSDDSEQIEKLRMSLVPVSSEVLEPIEEELKVELRN